MSIRIVERDQARTAIGAGLILGPVSGKAPDMISAVRQERIKRTLRFQIRSAIMTINMEEGYNTLKDRDNMPLPKLLSRRIRHVPETILYPRVR